VEDAVTGDIHHQKSMITLYTPSDTPTIKINL